MSTIIQDNEIILQHVQLYRSYASDGVYLFDANLEYCPDT
jgi:hypothetical protein